MRRTARTAIKVTRFTRSAGEFFFAIKNDCAKKGLTALAVLYAEQV